MSFDELKNYAISDILSVNGKDKTARIIKNHMDNLIKVALIKGAQSRQAEIDELRKRIDLALNVMCKLQYSSGERIYDEVGKILKGDQS